MLTAGVYFQYKPAHRCKTELDPRNASFENETPIDFKLTTFENKHKNGCYVVRLIFVPREFQVMLKLKVER